MAGGSGPHMQQRSRGDAGHKRQDWEGHRCMGARPAGRPNQICPAAAGLHLSLRSERHCCQAPLPAQRSTPHLIDDVARSTCGVHACTSVARWANSSAPAAGNGGRERGGGGGGGGMGQPPAQAAARSARKEMRGAHLQGSRPQDTAQAHGATFKSPPSWGVCNQSTSHARACGAH